MLWTERTPIFTPKTLIKQPFWLFVAPFPDIFSKIAKSGPKDSLSRSPRTKITQTKAPDF